MSDNDVKRKAVALMRAAVDDAQFVELQAFPLLYECSICWAVVHVSSKSLHLDWHDVVHGGLVEVMELLKK